MLAVFSELLPCPLKFVVPVSECFFFLEVAVELSVGGGYDNIWRPEEAKYSLVSFGNLLNMKMLNHFYHAYKLYIKLLQLSVRLQQISLIYKNFEVLFSSEADRTLDGFRVKVLFSIESTLIVSLTASGSLSIPASKVNSGDRVIL